MERKGHLLLIAACMVCFLLYSVAASADEYARKAAIAYIKGKVDVKFGMKSQWLPAQVNMILGEGDTIRTGKDSYADLVYFGVDKTDPKAVSRLEPDTILNIDLSIEGDTPEDGMTILKLVTGTIVSKVADLTKASEFQVHTPNSIIGVRGTELRVSQPEGKVCVHDKGGQVVAVPKVFAYRNDGSPVTVSALNSADILTGPVTWEIMPSGSAYSYKGSKDNIVHKVANYKSGENYTRYAKAKRVLPAIYEGVTTCIGDCFKTLYVGTKKVPPVIKTLAEGIVNKLFGGTPPPGEGGTPGTGDEGSKYRGLENIPVPPEQKEIGKNR